MLTPNLADLRACLRRSDVLGSLTSEVSLSVSDTDGLINITTRRFFGNCSWEFLHIHTCRFSVNEAQVCFDMSRHSREFCRFVSRVEQQRHAWIESISQCAKHLDFFFAFISIEGAHTATEYFALSLPMGAKLVRLNTAHRLEGPTVAQMQRVVSSATDDIAKFIHQSAADVYHAYKTGTAHTLYVHMPDKSVQALASNAVGRDVVLADVQRVMEQWHLQQLSPDTADLHAWQSLRDKQRALWMMHMKQSMSRKASWSTERGSGATACTKSGLKVNFRFVESSRHPWSDMPALRVALARELQWHDVTVTLTHTCIFQLGSTRSALDLKACWRVSIRAIVRYFSRCYQCVQVAVKDVPRWGSGQHLLCVDILGANLFVVLWAANNGNAQSEQHASPRFRLTSATGLFQPV
jgi:hypothetical protein